MYGSMVYLPKSYHPYGSSTYEDMSGPEGYLAKTKTFCWALDARWLGIRRGYTDLRRLLIRHDDRDVQPGARQADCVGAGAPRNDDIPPAAVSGLGAWP